MAKHTAQVFHSIFNFGLTYIEEMRIAIAIVEIKWNLKSE